jgi:hypothetical protein
MGMFDFLYGDGGSKFTDKSARLWDQLKGLAPEEQQYRLAQYVEQGVLTPTEAEAVSVGTDPYSGAEFDTVGKNAQMAALQQLQDIGSEGGLTASDKSKLAAIQNQEQSQARGSREAILQNAQARGMGGSGLELMAQLQNQQESVNRQSSRDMDVAAQAQERALQAIQQAGQMGGQLNQQQFGQQKSLADSRSAIEQFNAQNKQNVGLQNVAAKNQAQAANLQNKQNIANQNVDQLTQQQQLNAGAKQQAFNNQQAIAKGKSDALTNQAVQANADRKGNKDEVGGLLGGIGKAATKVFPALSIFSDERMKKDVEEFKAGDFLDSLTGYRYNYKDPGIDDESQVGVMAQDLEKEVPQMVEDTPKGKMVDYSPSKAGGPIFAGLSDIHERLKKLEGK